MSEKRNPTRTETRTTAATDPEALVDRLADPDSHERLQAFRDLSALGPTALPAVRKGLGHGSWQVRRWCTAHLDHHADGASLPLLLPLLHDPKRQVRLWAVHSLACDRCKAGENPIDVVPHLIERIEQDESIRVRRMATAMLAYLHPDARGARVFEAILRDQTDAKLRLHARGGLARCLEAGIATAQVE